MSFHFLYTMVDIFKGYFDEDFDEDSLRDNFTLVYELLDEMLDFGYPQNCALDVLKMYINLGSLRAPTSAAADKQMTSTITGARDWRRDGIVHKKNEVFLDVDESVNLLVSASGAVLKNDVSAKIVMKALLSGMPECKLGLNDKVVMDKDGGGKAKKSAGVDIDDCTFHRCVQLGKFDSDRTITFVPPDGEFELMRYRITENVNLPFRIIPSIEEHGATKVVLNIKATANFSSQLFATNVAIKIPVRFGPRGRERACARVFVWRVWGGAWGGRAAGSRGEGRHTTNQPPTTHNSLMRTTTISPYHRLTPLLGCWAGAATLRACLLPTRVPLPRPRGAFFFLTFPPLARRRPAGPAQHGADAHHRGPGARALRARAQCNRVAHPALPRRAGDDAVGRGGAHQVHQGAHMGQAAADSRLPGAHVHGERPQRALAQGLRAQQLHDDQVGALRDALGVVLDPTVVKGGGGGGGAGRCHRPPLFFPS